MKRDITENWKVLYQHDKRSQVVKSVNMKRWLTHMKKAQFDITQKDRTIKYVETNQKNTELQWKRRYTNYA